MQLFLDDVETRRKTTEWTAQWRWLEGWMAGDQQLQLLQWKRMGVGPVLLQQQQVM